jgi:hypothetical protein
MNGTIRAIQWLMREGKALAVLFVCFSFYFGVFIVLKKLILAHYNISFYGFGAALVGAFIAAKAFLVIESLPLPKFLRATAPFIKIVYQVLVCTTLALMFLYIEESLKLIHKEGTFRLAFLTATRESDPYEFCARVGWAGLTFLHYGVFVEISRRLGPGVLLGWLFTPSRADIEHASVTHLPSKES